MSQRISHAPPNMTALEFHVGLQRVILDYCEKTGVDRTIIQDEAGHIQITSPTNQLTGFMQAHKVPRKDNPLKTTHVSTTYIRYAPFEDKCACRV